jgi:DNA polymerase-4
MAIFPRIMLIDMDSFFASVEQQATPSLRGKPVGVCASFHPGSCLIAASKEAKVLGIKTGTLVGEALKRCPDLNIIGADPMKYREVNHKINKIFYDYTDKVEEYSIDESFLELNLDNKYLNSKQFLSYKTLKNKQDFEHLNLEHSDLFRISDLEFRIFSNTLAVAVDIKKRIKEEVGEWLTCSIGIGENKFLAKLASDMDKPDGLMVLWKDQLPLVYQNIKLRDLWGIARGWERRLASIGITSPIDLLSFPVQNLISIFGKPGYYIWQRVNGLEIDAIAPARQSLGDGGSEAKQSLTETVWDSPSLSPKATSPPQVRENKSEEDQPKSFGHSWVLNFRTKNKKFLEPVVMHLAEKAARRMRKDGFVAGGFYFGIFCANGESYFKSKKINFFMNTGEGLFTQAVIFWRSWVFQSDVSKIALGFNNLKRYSCQLDLFSSREQRLTDALDAVNDRYGEFTIKSATLMHNQAYSPDAIAFGK